MYLLDANIDNWSAKFSIRKSAKIVFARNYIESINASKSRTAKSYPLVKNITKNKAFSQLC